MRSLFAYLLHALILWVLTRGLVALAVSSGSQDLWALAAATAATVGIAGLAAAWLLRLAADSVPSLLSILLPLPLLGAGWAGWSAAAYSSTPAQIAVASGAWVLGAALGVVLVILLRRKRRRRDEMGPAFA
ncbi:hypothetical protein [Ornithinimicrobium sp. Y1694]|uniref:hypothetical protein n=1 Tax=Ornithinimicrobium sp. Y1694 TaxID=3418590 RepID=UPI003CEB5192